jgi:serine/threonine protein kinase
VGGWRTNSRRSGYGLVAGPGDGADVPVDLDLPGYRDFALIARGGQSVVYRARQEGLDRLVAIKVLAPPLPEDEARGRDVHGERWFQRELEITVRLGQAHPHIVTVLDTRHTGAGEPCIVMEYYPLGSLHDQLRALGRLPSGAVLTAGTVIADALAFAHAQGVLHRDVKPQNILVLPTSYVLTDFGLARAIETERSESLERLSYRHAAPQVLDGELPTAADDVYSLASTLFTLLDGRPPVRHRRPGRHRPGLPAPGPDRGATEDHGTDAPPDLLAIIERCLSRDREARLPDAASLRDTLAAIASETRMWAPGATARPRLSAQRTRACPGVGGDPRPDAVVGGRRYARGPAAGGGTVYGSSSEAPPGTTDVRPPVRETDPEPLIPWTYEEEKPRGATPWMTPATDTTDERRDDRPVGD